MAEDVWTIQRLARARDSSSSACRRRRWRISASPCAATCAASSPTPGHACWRPPADLKALLILGFYDSVEEENVSTSLRGFDPTLYTSLDFVCLATDGRLKPIVEEADALVLSPSKAEPRSWFDRLTMSGIGPRSP